jgi:pseudaminic acid cytidylyltransferase
VINEVLRCYKDSGEYFEYGACIYPTSPLIREEHLIQGYNKLKIHNFDTVLPIVPFNYPVWRGFEIADSEKIKMIWPEFLTTRSQDLKAVYHDAGQWYWFNTTLLAGSNALYNKNTGYIQLTELEAQDIDNLTDWELAEIKYKLLNALKY